MNLFADIIFVKALHSCQSLIKLLPAKAVYNTAIALPDKDLVNVKMPYVIVAFDGLKTDNSTKDDNYTASTDEYKISIEIAAKNREQLGNIAELIRTTISSYFATNYGDDTDEDFALIPDDISIEADRVVFDDRNPCYWQVLHYNCIKDSY